MQRKRIILKAWRCPFQSPRFQQHSEASLLRLRFKQFECKIISVSSFKAMLMNVVQACGKLRMLSRFAIDTARFKMVTIFIDRKSDKRSNYYPTKFIFILFHLNASINFKQLEMCIKNDGVEVWRRIRRMRKMWRNG